jgi:hypothetical protein
MIKSFVEVHKRYQKNRQSYGWWRHPLWNGSIARLGMVTVGGAVIAGLFDYFKDLSNKSEFF